MKRFSFYLWPSLITAVMFCILMGLGFWQVQRLAWKQELLAQIQRNMKADALDVGHLMVADSSMSYRAVMVRGAFIGNKNILLYRPSKDGDVGYHVIAPFRRNDGRVVFVDRGFVPEHTKLPVLTWDTVNLRGVLRIPPMHKAWLAPENNPDKKTWYWLDVPAMANALDLHNPLPFMIEADDAGHGYPIGGQTLVSIPNNHLTYAITWFGLALVLLVIYGVFSFFNTNNPMKPRINKF